LANNDAGAKLVAVNFFFAQFDESVSQRTEQKEEWMTVAVPVRQSPHCHRLLLMLCDDVCR